MAVCKINCSFSSVAEPKLFNFGSDAGFGSSHIQYCHLKLFYNSIVSMEVEISFLLILTSSKLAAVNIY